MKYLYLEKKWGTSLYYYVMISKQRSGGECAFRVTIYLIKEKKNPKVCNKILKILENLMD